MQVTQRCSAGERAGPRGSRQLHTLVWCLGRMAGRLCSWDGQLEHLQATPPVCWPQGGSVDKAEATRPFPPYSSGYQVVNRGQATFRGRRIRPLPNARRVKGFVAFFNPSHYLISGYTEMLTSFI